MEAMKNLKDAIISSGSMKIIGMKEMLSQGDKGERYIL